MASLIPRLLPGCELIDEGCVEVASGWLASFPGFSLGELIDEGCVEVAILV